MSLFNRDLPCLSLLACSLLVSGCGDDAPAGEDTDGSSTGEQSTDPTTTSNTTPTTDDSDDTTGNPPTTTDDASTTDDSATTDESTGSTSGEDSTGSTGGEAGPYVAGGAFAGLPGYENTDATGFALIVRRADGTDVSVQVSGLDADTDYPAHVHAQACADDSGGAHYKIDPAIPDTQEDNELWPAFTTDGDGIGRIEISSDHLAREDAMSVVVHDPNNNNEKMLCADLVTTGNSDPFVTAGDATVLQGADDAGHPNMTADATMERSVDGGTTVTLNVDGVGADTTYAVHVHDRDCASGDGGFHYKIDYGLGGTEDNELWLPVTTDNAGSGTSMVMSDHLARAEAQAIVVHADPDGGARMACIDLDVQ